MGHRGRSKRMAPTPSLQRVTSSVKAVRLPQRLRRDFVICSFSSAALILGVGLAMAVSMFLRL